MILIDDGSLWRNQGRYLLDVSVVFSVETAAGILSATEKHKWGSQKLMVEIFYFAGASVSKRLIEALRASLKVVLH